MKLLSILAVLSIAAITAAPTNKIETRPADVPVTQAFYKGVEQCGAWWREAHTWANTLWIGTNDHFECRARLRQFILAHNLRPTAEIRINWH